MKKKKLNKKLKLKKISVANLSKVKGAGVGDHRHLGTWVTQCGSYIICCDDRTVERCTR